MAEQVTLRFQTEKMRKKDNYDKCDDCKCVLYDYIDYGDFKICRLCYLKEYRFIPPEKKLEHLKAKQQKVIK
jgi:hypothetical protein